MNHTLDMNGLIPKLPIIQGGMGVGISLHQLAGHVAAEGGIGIISSAQVGYKEPDFLSHTLEANKRALISEITQAKKLAPNGIIGVNIMVALLCAASYKDEKATESVREMLSEDSHFLASYNNFIPVFANNKKLLAALIK